MESWDLISSCETAAPAVASGLVACATHRGPEYKRMEDFAACEDLGNCRALAIADGVGGSLHGEIASEIVVNTFLEEIRSAWTSRKQIGRGLVRKACRRACTLIAAAMEQHGLDSSPQATFIGVIELPKRLIVSYLGDGAVILSVSTGNYMLLLPHCGYGGFLTKVVGAGNCPKPAYLEIDKAWPEGAVILAGTDGVFPPGGSLKIAKNILSELRTRFQTDPARFDKVQAEEVLLSCISKLPFDDNRAVGVLVTDQAMSVGWQSKTEG